MIVRTTTTFVPYEQFDLDINLKVTAAMCNLDLASDTNLLQAINQGVSGVLLIARVYQHALT